jgi:cysteine desulfurase
MAKALELVEAERAVENARLRPLRDHLIASVLENVVGAQLTGSSTKRLDGHASFVIAGVEAEGILIGLDLAGIAVSSGSACTSGAQQPSHVLVAMGLSSNLAVGALRFTLGRSTTPEAMAYVEEKLPQIVARIREDAPL